MSMKYYQVCVYQENCLPCMVKTVYQVWRLSCILSYPIVRVSFHIVYHEKVNVAGTVSVRDIVGLLLLRRYLSFRPADREPYSGILEYTV